MTALTSAWPALLNDPHALLETVIIVGIVSVASIGFVTGLRELAQDLGNLRKAKVCVGSVAHQCLQFAQAVGIDSQVGIAET